MSNLGTRAVRGLVERALGSRTMLHKERANADRLAEALRLTHEYIGEETLPALEGWSWHDALRAHEELRGRHSDA